MTEFDSIARIGYGAMVLEGYYGGIEDSQSVEVLRHAIERGAMIDSADAYGGGHNEELVAKAVKGRRDKAFIATKFGIVFDEGETGNAIETGWGFSLNVNGSREYAQKSLNASLRRLGCDYINLYYLHYPDPKVDIEESVGAMAREVEAGKVVHIGLSNVTAEQVRRAHTVHPVSAVQYEYSIWRREAEIELLPTLCELGIALVAWSPLGAGFLAGASKALPEGDFRNNNPRFTGDNLQANQDRFAPLLEIAEALDITPAQLALAWLLHQGNDIYAIPGSRKIERINENAKATNIKLPKDMLEKINTIAPVGITKGATLV